MAKLTGRDYKGSQRRALEVRGAARVRLWRSSPGWCWRASRLPTSTAACTSRAESADTPHPDPHRAARADTEASGPGSGKTAEKYDFYEMLPNFEVVVPEKDKDVKRDLPATAKIERPGVYVLQAGSYRNEADAESRACAARAAGRGRQGAARRGRRRRLAPRAHRPDQ